jgi:aspartokinase-like uncharacterized kinase
MDHVCGACAYAGAAQSHDQACNMPDNLHRKLKLQAALAGMSLSDYLVSEMYRVDRSTIEELRTRLQGRPAVMLSVAPAQAVRAERNR